MPSFSLLLLLLFVVIMKFVVKFRSDLLFARQDLGDVVSIVFFRDDNDDCGCRFEN